MTGDGTARPRMDPAQVVDAIQERFERLAVPGWAPFGLADRSESGWLCGVGEDQAGVTSIRVDYCPPGSAERLIVQSQPARSTAADLDGLLHQISTNGDEGEPFALYQISPRPRTSPPESSEILIEDMPTPAIVQRDGPCTVWQVVVGEVTVIVAARNISLDKITLKRITDLAPLQQRRKKIVEQLLASQLSPPPAL